MIFERSKQSRSVLSIFFYCGESAHENHRVRFGIRIELVEKLGVSINFLCKTIGNLQLSEHDQPFGRRLLETSPTMLPKNSQAINLISTHVSNHLLYTYTPIIQATAVRHKPTCTLYCQASAKKITSERILSSKISNRKKTMVSCAKAGCSLRHTLCSYVSRSMPHRHSTLTHDKNYVKL